MKKIISILICIVLLGSIGCTVYCFDPSSIQPDTTTYIIGVTDEDVPITGTLPQVIPGQIVIVVPGEIIEPNSVNPPRQQQQKTEEENTIETNNDVDEPTNKEDVDTTPESSEKTQFIEEIFKLINEERTNIGLKELNYNFELQNSVDIRARESAEQFSHTRPDGTSCFTVVDEIDYTIVGENLIKGDNAIVTAKAFVNNWMNSEGHRANILNVNFTETAIGVYEKDGVTYAAQIFMG